MALVESFKLDDVMLLVATVSVQHEIVLCRHFTLTGSEHQAFGIANFVAIAMAVREGLGQRIDRLSAAQVDHSKNVALPQMMPVDKSLR